jgi:hypothetical protein
MGKSLTGQSVQIRNLPIGLEATRLGAVGSISKFEQIVHDISQKSESKLQQLKEAGVKVNRPFVSVNELLRPKIYTSSVKQQQLGVLKDEIGALSKRVRVGTNRPPPRSLSGLGFDPTGQRRNKKKARGDLMAYYASLR